MHSHFNFSRLPFFHNQLALPSCTKAMLHVAACSAGPLQLRRADYRWHVTYTFSAIDLHDLAVRLHWEPVQKMTALARSPALVYVGLRLDFPAPKLTAKSIAEIPHVVWNAFLPACPCPRGPTDELGAAQLVIRPGHVDNNSAIRRPVDQHCTACDCKQTSYWATQTASL